MRNRSKYLLITVGLVIVAFIAGNLLSYTVDFGTIFQTKKQTTPIMASIELQSKLELDVSQEGKWTDQLVALYLSQTNPKVTYTLEELARQQVKTLHYQTIYRDPQSPLPDNKLTFSLQKATYDQNRKRIIVPYKATGYIVTTEKELYDQISGLDDTSKNAADTSPDTFTDTFIVPADPTKLFQRLGYACANQDGVPLGSVTDINYGEYFDPKCAPGVKLCVHPQGKRMDSCLNTLQKENGVGSLTIKYTVMDYDPVLAANWQTDTTPVSKGVDLTVDKEKLGEYDIVYKKFEPNSCAIQEACVKGPGVRRLLRFNGAGKNIGDTNLVFGNLDTLQKTNQFHYNACHKHYHMDGYAQYSLGKPGQAPVTGSKQSFCVEGSNRNRNDADTSFNSDYDCQNQGINAGWEDEYFIGLDCQWVDITDLPISGNSEQFQLSMEVNSDKLMCEGQPLSNGYVPALDNNNKPLMIKGKPVMKQACNVNSDYYKNNKATVTVTIPKTGSSINQACSTIDYGSKRNCGWDMNEVKSCKPGEKVRVINPKELLRVCPDSFSCAYDEALVSTDQKTTTFTCPKEGKYLLMSGAYIAQ